MKYVDELRDPALTRAAAEEIARLADVLHTFMVERHKKPTVVCGFEPLDLLQSIAMILKQIRESRAEVENQYARVVPWDGTNAALTAIADVFELRLYFEWRGLGFLSQSALRLRDAYGEWTPNVASRSPVCPWRIPRPPSSARLMRYGRCQAATGAAVVGEIRDTPARTVIGFSPFGGSRVI